MDSLHSFIEEMLKEEIPKEPVLEALLKLLDEQPMPSLESARCEFDYKTKLHGIIIDYQKKEVSLNYLVVESLVPTYTLSFEAFEVILEGLLSCRRKRKWSNQII